MKKYWSLILLFILFSSSSFAQKSASASSSYEERDNSNSKLNTKRFEKYLNQHKEELNLTKRQVKDLNKIDRRYAKTDRKLSRNDAKRRDHQELDKLKREEMLDVLTNEQQDHLQALIKKGRFSFDQLFGK